MTDHRLGNESKTTGDTNEVGNAYLFGAHGFIPCY